MSSATSVAGYEFSERLEFCEGAIRILKRLRDRGCVYFQIDDGEHLEVGQLRAAADDGHFEFVALDSHRYVVFSQEDCEIEVTW